MTPLIYSSMAAFLAHYRALNEAAGAADRPNKLSADECEVLNALRSLMAGLTEEEKSLLAANAVEDRDDRTAARRRHRQRAELKLRRTLTEKGILRG